MSKRSANCDHVTLVILPGNRIVCRDCGEEAGQEDIMDFIKSNEPVSIQVPNTGDYDGEGQEQG